MNILITGAKGFVGKNLVENLKNIRDGKNRSYPELSVGEIYEYDIDSDASLLDDYCKNADFVFNLAGVNRPKTEDEFMKGNFGFASTLLETLEKHGNTCPVMLSSSVQASLTGRFKGSVYGESKRAGENLFFHYSRRTGAKVLVYRFPNLFGKWCRPNYNSAVATFCYNIAHDLPIQVSDPSVELELVYIDDLVREMMSALAGKEHRCVPSEVCSDGETGDKRGKFADMNGFDAGKNAEKADVCARPAYCFVPVSHRVTLGNIVKTIESFKAQRDTLFIPDIPAGSFEKKLYSTYLSYLPADKVVVPLKMNTDERGSFTEVLKTTSHGQFSVNISRPGITKGQHWHNTKWEFFIVVSGEALIEERKIGSDEVLRFKVSGKKIEAVHMLPGYTHNIINLSDTDELVTLMWANETLDKDNPDTFYEKV